MTPNGLRVLEADFLGRFLLGTGILAWNRPRIPSVNAAAFTRRMGYDADVQRYTIRFFWVSGAETSRAFCVHSEPLARSEGGASNAVNSVAESAINNPGRQTGSYLPCFMRSQALGKVV